MDLLSSYDDDVSNSNAGDQQVNKPVNTGLLQSEWEIFEKSIGSSSQEINTTLQTVESKEVEELPVMNAKSVMPEMSTACSLPSGSKEAVEEEEEDESHLPPGVRKKNRCHNSSSSSSEDGAKGKSKSHSDTDHSDSEDTDTSQDKSREKDKRTEGTKEKKASQSREESQRSYRKTRSSKSMSKSRSKSRSPRRKRKKSSDYRKRSRSRSTGRHHREKKRGSLHARSRDRKRSRDRDHRHHHREQRRSRSRDRRKHRERKGSSDRNRRSRSRDRDRRKKSPSPRGAKVIKYGDKVIKAGASFGRPPVTKPLTFKEKMRQQLIKAMEEGGDVSQALTDKDGTVICTQTAGTQQVPAPKKPPVPLMANLVTSTAGLSAATITASEAAMQSIIALQKETTEKTGVEIPKYYNPAAINPMKYAEQVQKRKLLWSKTKDKEVNSQWHATTLSSEHDSKSKEKFRKLMGIKQEESSAVGEDDKTTEEQELKQRELFEKLDKEYQYARMATHTHRGIGLGFGSAGYQPPNS